MLWRKCTSNILIFAFAMLGFYEPASSADSKAKEILHPFEAYNEAYDENGKLRPAFQALKKRIKKNPLKPKPIAASILSSSPMGDDIKILPLPWALSRLEFQFIQKATAQRAEALRKLFIDLFINEEPEILKKGIFSKDFIEQLCLNETQRSYESIRNFWKRRNPDDVSFIYGPDLARLISGIWVFIEDNVGNIGGRADTFHLKEPFSIVTGIKSQEKSTDDFVSAIKVFMQNAGTSPEKTLAIFDFDKDKDDEDKTPFSFKDKENIRELMALESAGIEKIFDGTDLNRKKLKGLMDKIDNESIEALLLIDHPNGTWDVYDEWLEFLAARPNLKIFNGPFVNTLSSKALLPYMDQITEFFEGQTPHIKTLESFPVQNLADLDAAEELYGENFILKTTNGTQGEEVYPRAKYPEKNWKAIRKYLDTLRAWGKYNDREFPNFVVQPFVNFSYLPTETPWIQFMLDLRPITYVFMGSVMPGTSPWARANMRLGKNLTNVSQGAFETVVFIEDCEASLLD
ncbi:MAG: hypothetical protein KA116_07720 [Proteobacteria bacterium]|nr:hypothetical protein [Pseudomonadota bacterium]